MQYLHWNTHRGAPCVFTVFQGVHQKRRMSPSGSDEGVVTTVYARISSTCVMCDTTRPTGASARFCVDAIKLFSRSPCVSLMC